MSRGPPLGVSEVDRRSGEHPDRAGAEARGAASRPTPELASDAALNGDPLKLVTIRLSGKRPGGGLDRADDSDLRPALFAAYRGLDKLRYDFPMILVEGVGGEGFVRTLSGLVDQMLQAIAPRGADGARLRGHLLGLEQELRGLVAGGR